MRRVVFLQNVSKVFKDGTKALDNITLEIFENEIVLLRGISGSGKTTLLSLIGALDRATEGKVEVDGVVVSKLPQSALEEFRRKNVGIILQDFGLIEYLSVYENVLAPLIPLNLNKKEAAKRVQEALKKANISHKAQTKAAHLSGGEKQRCAIARAVVNRAKLILCDEPSANLDRENSKQFISLLQELHTKGHTIIVATHDPIFEELLPTARKIHITDGKIA